MELDRWKSQMRKGAAELAVLSVLDGNELYGIEILDRLSGAEGLGLSDGTIYPLLKRMQTEGRIAARWEPSVTGPPRKYYRLTQSGRDALALMADFWAQFQQQMNTIVERR
jgi:PadR family transcriptional regulator PadR